MGWNALQAPCRESTPPPRHSNFPRFAGDRDIPRPIIRSPIVHRLDVRGEVSDETRANEEKQSRNHNPFENPDRLKINQGALASRKTHRIGSSPMAPAS